MTGRPRSFESLTPKVYPCTFYKVLFGDRSTKFGGAYVWPRVGQWTTPIVNPMMCKTGYHLIDTRTALRTWVADFRLGIKVHQHGMAVYLAQGRGRWYCQGHNRAKKWVFESARLTKLVYTTSTKPVHPDRYVYLPTAEAMMKEIREKLNDLK